MTPLVYGASGSAAAMALDSLAAEPAHLPHYGPTGIVVGTVIMLSIVVLTAVATFAWAKRR